MPCEAAAAAAALLGLVADAGRRFVLALLPLAGGAAAAVPVDDDGDTSTDLFHAGRGCCPSTGTERRLLSPTAPYVLWRSYSRSWRSRRMEAVGRTLVRRRRMCWFSSSMRRCSRTRLMVEWYGRWTTGAAS